VIKNAFAAQTMLGELTAHPQIPR